MQLDFYETWYSISARFIVIFLFMWPFAGAAHAWLIGFKLKFRKKSIEHVSELRLGIPNVLRRSAWGAGRDA